MSPSPHRILRRPGPGLARTARIFGIGLSRTGTTTLCVALNVLGYASVHFPSDATTRRELLDYLDNGGHELRLSVLDQTASITDTPACVAFEALDAAYPGSKFILTTRDKEAWLDSCRYFWATWTMPFLADRENDAIAGDYVRAICRSLYGVVDFDRPKFADAFDAYHQRVRDYFSDRPKDLLTIDITRGARWAELCTFLDRPEPWVPFPWMNAKPS